MRVYTSFVMMSIVVLLIVSCRANPPNDPVINEEPKTDKSQVTVIEGEKETVTRQVEGMTDKVDIVHYELVPYNILFQIDAFLGAPTIDGEKVTFSNDYVTVSLEVLEQSTLEETVQQLQRDYKQEGYEETGQLKDTDPSENDFTGKKQYFLYPVKGFYAYAIDEDVLVITYRYPQEAGDGMFPMLKALRQSIDVK